MKKQLKICEIIDTYYPTVDGAISVARNYSHSLNKITDCVLAVPSPEKNSGYVDNDDFKIIRCKSKDAPEKYRMGTPDFDYAFKKKLEEENFDIIHTHSPYTMGKFAITFGRKNHIPVVATLHTQYHQDFERVFHHNKMMVDIAINYIIDTYKKADSVWTVSNASCKFLRDYGYKGKIEVVRNGTDYVYPKNAEELIDRINKEHNLYNQKNVFLFVGRMAWYKNLKILIDSAKQLKKEKLDFKLLLVGGGFDIDDVKDYAEYLGVTDKVIFVGNVSDRELLQGYYLRSDLMLFPSTFDMASIAKVEAAAHKTPSLVIKGSCSAEEVIDNENGFLSIEDTSAFTKRILEIASNPDLYKSVGENAYKTLYRTWDDVAKEVKEKYEKIILKYKIKEKSKERLKEFKKIKKEMANKYPPV